MLEKHGSSNVYTWCRGFGVRGEFYTFASEGTVFFFCLLRSIGNYYIAATRTDDVMH